MKLLRFNIKVDEQIDAKTGEQISVKVSPYYTPYHSEADMEWAKKHAIDGEVTIDEVPDPVETPTQLDRVESQVAYLAMMMGYTDILEV